MQGLSFWIALFLAFSEGVIASSPKKILHYCNHMGAADTSPVPRKDSMGMDYIPIYEDKGAASVGDAKR